MSLTQFISKQSWIILSLILPNLFLFGFFLLTGRFFPRIHTHTHTFWFFHSLIFSLCHFHHILSFSLSFYHPLLCLLSLIFSHYFSHIYSFSLSLSHWLVFNKEDIYLSMFFNSCLDTWISFWFIYLLKHLTFWIISLE